MAEPALKLPPGYRFMPTDQELVLFWLRKRARGEWLPSEAVVDLDIYGEEPWKIFGTSWGQKFYVFTKLKKKGEKRRVERSAGVGTWKGQRSDQVKDRRNRVVGHKKLFVFEVKDSNSSKSNSDDKDPHGHWIMHEFSLPNDESDYVLCEIRNKNAPAAELEEIYDYEEEVEQVVDMLETGQLPRHDRVNDSSTYSSAATTVNISQDQSCYGKRKLAHEPAAINCDHDQPQPKRLRSRSTDQQNSTANYNVVGPIQSGEQQTSTTLDDLLGIDWNANIVADPSKLEGEQQTSTSTSTSTAEEEANAAAGSLIKLGEQLQQTSTTVEEGAGNIEEPEILFSWNEFNFDEEFEALLNEGTTATLDDVFEQACD